jgi:hypothetical protein
MEEHHDGSTTTSGWAVTTTASFRHGDGNGKRSSKRRRKLVIVLIVIKRVGAGVKSAVDSYNVLGSGRLQTVASLSGSLMIVGSGSIPCGFRSGLSIFLLLEIIFLCY